jgi:hypothetical protein
LIPSVLLADLAEGIGPYRALAIKWGGEGKNCSFLKERTKELLSVGACLVATSDTKLIKVFLFLFLQKKKILTYFA